VSLQSILMRVLGLPVPEAVYICVTYFSLAKFPVTKRLENHWLKYLFSIQLQVNTFALNSLTSPSQGHFHFSKAQQTLMGQDLLIIYALRSHSVRLLWTSDQHDAEISTRQNTSVKIERHPCVSNPQPQQSKALDCAVTGLGSLFSYINVFFRPREHVV
jgi:hypothetical protein